jgi:hypothetical protein
MITAAGENAIGAALAYNLGTHIAVGVGSTAPTLNDKQLNFEVARAEVRTRSYDPTTNALIFTATLPDHLDIFINEVALLSTPFGNPTGGIVTKFDQSLEDWTGGTFTTNNVRVGATGLTVALGTASTSAGTRVALTESAQSDIFQVAFFGAGGTVEVRLTNSTTDYHAFTFPATAGYNVVSVPVHTMTKTGTPDLASANGVTIVHSDSGSVTMDAIRISSEQATDTIVVRQTFAPAQRKVAGMPLDIEIPLGVTLA